MKKFMKGCAITAAVLFLLGLLLAIAGGTARGSQAISEVVQKVTGGRVSVNFGDVKEWGVTIADVIDSGAVYDINEHSIFEHSYKIYKGDVAKYCPGTDIGNLDIEAGGCVLETKASRDDKFYIEVTKAYKFQGYVKDSTLYIKASNGAKTWNKMGSCTITLYVPKNFSFGTVDVEIGAGVLEFSEPLAGDYISLEAGAGQIVIDDIIANTVELEVGAGEIELKNMEVAELNAEIGMGNLEASGTVQADAHIECAMGNVDLTLAGGEKNYNYTVECAMGNIDIGSRSYSGLAKEMSIDNGAEATIELECAMGNITVSFDNAGIGRAVTQLIEDETVETVDTVNVIQAFDEGTWISK